MSEHRIELSWKRTSEDFKIETYNRQHEWKIEGGSPISVTAAPEYFGDPTIIDPERALVGALSSCHMLTFLAFAAKKGLVVDSYQDEAVGILEKGPEGKMMVSKVTLQPKIVFQGETPDEESLKGLHNKAHQFCFISNSVKTEVEVK